MSLFRTDANRPVACQEGPRSVSGHHGLSRAKTVGLGTVFGAAALTAAVTGPGASIHTDAPVTGVHPPAVAPSVDVMTFNVAGDGARGDQQRLIPDAWPIQAAIHGAPWAPVINFQETTRTLARELQAACHQTGQCEYIYTGNTRLPALLLSSPFVQQNSVLVPTRFRVLHTDVLDYPDRAGLMWDALKGVPSGRSTPNDVLGASQRRGILDVQLQDTLTGGKFSDEATHLNGDERIRETEEPLLLQTILRAEQRGPVWVGGDFNTSSLATSHGDPAVTRFWRALEPAQLTDVKAATPTEGGSDAHIDHVLVHGFNVRSADVLDGTKLTVPGRPTADQVSDHFAVTAALVDPTVVSG